MLHKKTPFGVFFASGYFKVTYIELRHEEVIININKKVKENGRYLR